MKGSLLQPSFSDVHFPSVSEQLGCVVDDAYHRELVVFRGWSQDQDRPDFAHHTQVGDPNLTRLDMLHFSIRRFSRYSNSASALASQILDRLAFSLLFVQSTRKIDDFSPFVESPAWATVQESRSHSYAHCRHPERTLSIREAVPPTWPAPVLAFLAFTTLTKARADDAPSFRNQVQPILARFGCSTGACHGAAAGRAASSSPCSATTTTATTRRSPVGARAGASCSKIPRAACSC